MANSPSGESVLRRFVRIISAFDSTHTSMSVASVVRRSRLPVTTVYRLVDELLAERLLERDGNGNVRIGIRLWELASRSSPMLGLRESALPFMEDVQSVIQHHTTLGILDGSDVLYVERLNSASSAVDITTTAGRLPIHATSSGLVLLAHSTPAYQELVLSRSLTAYTDATVTDPRRLRLLLADVRREGFSAVPGIIVRESTGIAVPIFGPGNLVVAALSVIVPRSEENSPAWIPVLRSAARGISRALGWKGVDRGDTRRLI